MELIFSAMETTFKMRKICKSSSCPVNRLLAKDHSVHNEESGAFIRVLHGAQIQDSLRLEVKYVRLLTSTLMCGCNLSITFIYIHKLN